MSPPQAVKLNETIANLSDSYNCDKLGSYSPLYKANLRPNIKLNKRPIQIIIARVFAGSLQQTTKNLMIQIPNRIYR